MPYSVEICLFENLCESDLRSNNIISVLFPVDLPPLPLYNGRIVCLTHCIFSVQVSYLINTQKARINEAFSEVEGEAMTTRRKLEGRQGPKHLEKMLFTNNREEERLQRHLQELNNRSVNLGDQFSMDILCKKKQTKESKTIVRERERERGGDK